MSLDLKQLKRDERKRFADLRTEFYNSKVKPSEEVLNKLSQNLKIILEKSQLNPQVCAIYRSFGQEADPEGVCKLCPGWSWAYPRMNGDEIDFHLVKEGEKFKKNDYGIFEPDPLVSQKISINDCSVVLVPGRGFDVYGNRLGSGKGYYDKALSFFKGLKVGVGFSVQVSQQKLVTENHDIPLDLIVTENYILNPTV